MSYTEKKVKNINEAAKLVIDEIDKIKDPFITPTVVFHNASVAQWFKAFYLKNKTGVMMNVEFKTLSVFINELLSDTKVTIIDKTILRDYIIKTLIDSSNYSYDTANPTNPINYIFELSGELKGGLLYEFADKLATIFLDYELDKEDTNKIDKWEIDLFNRAKENAEQDGYYTIAGALEEKSIHKNSNGLVYIIDNSYITDLYLDILNSLNDEVTIFSIDAESTQENAGKCVPDKLITAPSILREVEAIHSEICKIIKENKDIRFNDIVVYLPDISKYTGSIKRVFQQDNKEFPSLPFCIVGEPGGTQDMLSSLQILFDIAVKGFYTRNDFVSFVKNPIIKRVYDIDDSDIENWIEAIIASNTYRNRESEDDWDYIKKRMLLSFLVSDNSEYENNVELGETKYIPFSTMNLDQYSINKMIDLIDKLGSWCNFFKDGLFEIVLDENKFEEISEVIDDIYSKENDEGEEKNYYYKKIRGEIERVKKVCVGIPAITFMRILLDAPNKHCTFPADMFARGITFIDINTNNIVGAPYIFVLGMSSNDFPRIDVKSELDKSNRHKTSREHDELAVKNIRLNTDNLIVSFVKYNLKTEEEYYLSPLFSENNLENITIDETRDFKDLFTKKEFKNKKYYEGIGGNASVGTAINTNTAGAPVIDTELKVSDIKKFFENTFIYKYKKVLKIDDDNEEEIQNEYEPIDINKLVQRNIIKEMIQSDLNEDDQKEYVFLRKLLEEGIGNGYFEYYYDYGAQPVIDLIKNDGYHLANTESLSLCAQDSNGENFEWKLSCNNVIYCRYDGNDLYYIEAADYTTLLESRKPPEELKPKKYIVPYIFSLMDVARMDNPEIEEEYNIHLVPIKNPRNIEKNYSITPKKAKNLLNKIYLNMINYKDIKYMEVDLLTFDMDNINSLYEFKKKIDNNSTWKNFDDKQMVDIVAECGYTDDTINIDIKNYQDNIKGLILFMQDKEEE